MDVQGFALWEMDLKLTTVKTVMSNTGWLGKGPLTGS
jgi:hypothetical protein